MKCEVAQLCLTLCDPMDCRLPGFSVHGIFQARVLEWVAIAFSITALTYSFPNLQPVRCSLSGSNCCFLTCIQLSHETEKLVWYSHLLRNFPQFVVIHTVKGFGIVNKAEIDVFLELFLFLMIQRMLTIWCLVPLSYLNPAWTSRSSQFTYCWNLTWRILSITSLACEMSAIVR